MTISVRNRKFDLLLDAIYRESPEKVREIVGRDRSILEERNSIGENVLTYCALEKGYDEVELLSSLGSSIPEQAVSEAIQAGNSDMLLCLLELGGSISPHSAMQSLSISEKSYKVQERVLHIMKSHLEAYGVHM